MTSSLELMLFLLLLYHIINELVFRLKLHPYLVCNAYLNFTRSGQILQVLKFFLFELNKLRQSLLDTGIYQAHLLQNLELFVSLHEEDYL